MMPVGRYISLTIIILLCAIHSVSVAQEPSATKIEKENNAQLRKYIQVFRYLTTTYIDEVAMSPLVEEAIRAMIKELDPHSAYISAEDMEDVEAQLQGEMSGIGVNFNVLRDTVMVTNTIEGAPAARVGVMPNDRIVSVDGQNIVGIKSKDVPKLLRGKTGTKVAVGVVRNGVDSLLNFTITRDKIPVNTISASYLIGRDVGYIKISRFAHSTLSEFESALTVLGRVGAYIIDLRGNSGGYINAPIEIASKFLHSGAVITTTTGRGVQDVVYTNRNKCVYEKERVVLLVDENSASGSELLAGALQDWDRAVIVGRRTFGKGLVQRQYSLPDGSALRVTVAKYLTPSGRAIQRPYEKGHTKEYYESHRERLISPNMQGIDTLTRRAYTTLRNRRTIYDGGGIDPDIVIAADTARMSKYVTSLFAKGILNEYVFDYIDSNRAKLKSDYPTFELFEKKFMVDDTLLSALLSKAVSAGIDTDDAEDKLSNEYLGVQIKALIAQRLFSTTEYYRIFNAWNDKELEAALALIRQPKKVATVLGY